MASLQGNRNCYALAILIMVSFYTTHADDAKIGVCYGTLSNKLPSAKEAVNLLQSTNIGKVRLYAARRELLHALRKSGIEVTVGVDNNELENIAGNKDEAISWVEENINLFYPSVNIKYIAVGNEVLANRKYLPYLMPAMHNIQTALINASLQNNIKISTPHGTSVLSKSFPPSEGTFGETERMSGILKFLSDNGSPFMVHVYPYFIYKDNPQSISADYALFRSTSTVVSDVGLMYNNLFDAMVDSFVSAMEKVGQSNMPIVVAETGWPFAGTHVATVNNAQTYNNNLIKHVLSNAGTPKRPGRSIETYIHALFIENLKDGAEEMRHFGLFETNNTPVYPLVFRPERPRNLKVVLIYITII